MPLPQRGGYTRKEAAEILGIGEATVYRLLKAGRLEKKRYVGFRLMVTEESINRLLQSDRH